MIDGLKNVFALIDNIRGIVYCNQVVYKINIDIIPCACTIRYPEEGQATHTETNETNNHGVTSFRNVELGMFMKDTN